MAGSRPAVLPERVEGAGEISVRRWLPEDAEALAAAVTESLEHLRPWMAWVTQEPRSVAGRRALIVEWEQRWREGGDVLMGIFVGDRVAGGTGLHRRIGPDGLEIGYWVHPGFLRRGVATTAAALLTDYTLGAGGFEYAEIHHDQANLASGGVPRKLGYTLIDETPDKPEAPAEVGICCRWRMTREEWERLGPLAPGLT